MSGAFLGRDASHLNNDDGDSPVFVNPRPSKLRDAAALQSVLQNTALMFQSPPDSP